MALHGFWHDNCASFLLGYDEPALVTSKPNLEDVSTTQEETSLSEISSKVFNTYQGNHQHEIEDPTPLCEVPLQTVPFVNLDIIGSSQVASNYVPRRTGIPLLIQCSQQHSAVADGSRDELLDPSVSLFYECLEETSPTLSEAATRFLHILQQHAEGKDVVTELIASIHDRPALCQVRYPYESYHLHPMGIFSVTGCVAGIRATYEAFSEAIGIEDVVNGLPLHMAVSNDQAEVAEFLKDAFPEALIWARGSDKQTPLHLACRHGSSRVIKLVMTPTNLQMMDKKGMYPVHRLCQNPNADEESFDLLAKASALVATSVTMDLQNPLHVVAETGNLVLLPHVYESAPSNARGTDDSLQVPLHLAACNNNLKAVEFLVRMLPAAIHAVDENGDRPKDVTADPGIKAHCSRYHVR